MAEIVSGHHGKDVMYYESVGRPRCSHRKLSNGGPGYRCFTGGDDGSTWLVHRSVLRGACKCYSDQFIRKSEPWTRDHTSSEYSEDSSIFPNRFAGTHKELSSHHDRCVLMLLGRLGHPSSEGNSWRSPTGSIEKRKSVDRVRFRRGCSESLSMTFHIPRTFLTLHFLQVNTVERNFMSSDQLLYRTPIEP